MRPHVFVNVAMSADGKISTKERRQVKISGREDFLRVDRIKAGSDAIMVGIGTVLADNPSLTVKAPDLREQRANRGLFENPIRVVIDSAGRTPPDADILHKGPGQRIVAVSERAPAERVQVLSRYATVIVTGKDEVDLRALLEILFHQEGVRTLMVEGGGTLIWSLLRDGLVDELQTYIGNVVIGGKDAPTPAEGAGFMQEANFIRLSLEDIERIEDGVLIRWRVTQSAAGSR